MSVANLAVVFAPTLFYIRGQKGQQMLKEVEMQVTTATVLKLLLEQHREVWIIPADIVAQLRFLNEAYAGRKLSNAKEVKKLLADKDKGKKRKSRDSFCVVSNVQWVADSKALPPVRALISVTQLSGQVQSGVKVCDDTTVEDVLSVRLLSLVLPDPKLNLLSFFPALLKRLCSWPVASYPASICARKVATLVSFVHPLALFFSPFLSLSLGFLWKGEDKWT